MISYALGRRGIESLFVHPYSSGLLGFDWVNV
jgi:hypothetical protein